MLYQLLVFISSILVINGDKYSYSSDSKPNKLSKPKNLIYFIADGLAPNYNTAYRLFAGIDETIFDKYLQGTYSTRAVDQSIIDSAASATALSSGILPKNKQIGTDEKMNPIANIFEAAKEKGKGIGVISNTRVTHATPASFTAHSSHRLFEDLIALQQGSKLTSDIDIIFGGGLRHFDGSRNGNTFNLMDDYSNFGWNSLVLSKSELLSLNTGDIPSIGLFTQSSFPDYMQRKNVTENNEIPGLLDMTKKALELLSDKYSDNGFMLMIEAGQIDWGGHANDLPYLLNEMDEYHNTVSYVINDFIANRKIKHDDTLVVMLADHGTGGLILGRQSLWNKKELVLNEYGILDKPNKDMTQHQTVDGFDYDPLVIPSLKDELGSVSHYDFFVQPALYSTRTALTVALMVNDINIINDDFTSVFDIIQMYYIEQLTQEEKSFIVSCYNRIKGGLINNCLTKILSVRMSVGWTTYGHSGDDIQISALGPYSNKFKGFNGNVEKIGEKLIDIFELKNEIKVVNDRLKDLFLSNDLLLCDNDVVLNGVDMILWPQNNYQYPGLCYIGN